MYVKFVDIGNAIDWNSVRNDQNDKIAVWNACNNFLTKFQIPIKIGSHVINSESAFNYFLQSGENPINNNHDDATSLAEDIIDGLCDNNVRAIWLSSNPSFASNKEKTYLFYKALFSKLNLIENHSKFSSFSQKPILGYCLMLPPMLFLGARGLARPIHTEQTFGDHRLLANEIAILKEIFHQQSSKQLVPEIIPANNAAHEIIHKPVRGTILGGLIDIVYKGIEDALDFEKQLGRKIISDKSLILFLELVDFGKEFEIAEKLIKLIAEGKLKIAAFCLADTLPNKQKDNSYQQSYYAKIDQKMNEIAAIADQLKIPICKGLKLGHAGRNYPLPMGAAEIKFDSFQAEKSSATLSIEYLTCQRDQKRKYAFWYSQNTSIPAEVQNPDEEYSESCKIS